MYVQKKLVSIKANERYPTTLSSRNETTQQILPYKNKPSTPESAKTM